MSGLGGLNKSPNGVVVGWCSCSCRWSRRRRDLAAQTARIVRAGRQGAAQPGRTMDLVVFPEYALHGLSMRHRARDDVPLDGPEVAAFQARPASTTRSGAASRSWKPTRAATPTTADMVIDDHGAIRALLPQAASVGAGRAVGARQPRRSGDATGRTAASSRSIICHDGMLPEMAREGAYKGAEIMHAHGGLHGADPPCLAHHQPGQRLLATWP